MLLPVSWALCFIVSIAFNNNQDSNMKLLHRIQALDASRRLDVVSKYIPALLVGKNDDDDDNNNIVVGHIHSNLVETIRKKLDEEGSNQLFRNSFLLPPPDDVDNAAASAAGGTTTTSLFRNRFFGLRVDETETETLTSTQKSAADTDTDNKASTSPSSLMVDARSAPFERFTDLLLECKIISKRHTDMYPITDLRKTAAGGEILATVNRNAAPFLGITSIGVHLLCYVRDDETNNNNNNNNNSNSNVSLWLAQRAADKSHNALRWDPTVAGGQPALMGFFDNVIKEAGEEAGIDPDLVAQTAVSTGCLSQMTCKRNDGTCMKQSLYYTWDMEVDRETFVPWPADGEVAAFELCSAEQLEYEVRHGDRLRPAMILVVADFLVRHGVITPDNEPDYAEILAAMHRERLVLEYTAHT